MSINYFASIDSAYLPMAIFTPLTVISTLSILQNTNMLSPTITHNKEQSCKNNTHSPIQSMVSSLIFGYICLQANSKRSYGQLIGAYQDIKLLNAITRGLNAIFLYGSEDFVPKPMKLHCPS